MALVSIPNYEPKRFRKQTLRELFARADGHLSEDGDRHALEMAVSYGDLDFEVMEREQQKRIAVALIVVADAYRAELLSVLDLNESDRSRAEALGELSLCLASLVESGR